MNAFIFNTKAESLHDQLYTQYYHQQFSNKNIFTIYASKMCNEDLEFNKRMWRMFCRFEIVASRFCVYKQVFLGRAHNPHVSIMNQKANDDHVEYYVRGSE